MRAGKPGGIAWLIAVHLCLAACTGATGRLFPRKQPGDIYRPPAIPASSTPVLLPAPGETLSASPQPAEMQPTPACANNLLFIEDLSIPDGALVQPGSLIDKRWSVENNGSCNWGEGYGLKLVAGPEMGARVAQALYPARSGTRATIRILFTAPQEPGAYRSAWQAFSPEGLPFGDPIFIEVSVGSAENP